MDSPALSALSNALDFGSAKLQAISNNLSNINAPGYKRKEATFASFLNAGDSEMLTQKRTNARHMDMEGNAGDQISHPTIISDGSGTMRLDGNNVDIDLESNRLAAAEIYYEGASQLISGQFASLKYVISGGGG